MEFIKSLASSPAVLGLGRKTKKFLVSDINHNCNLSFKNELLAAGYINCYLY